MKYPYDTTDSATHSNNLTNQNNIFDNNGNDHPNNNTIKERYVIITVIICAGRDHMIVSIFTLHTSTNNGHSSAKKTRTVGAIWRNILYSCRNTGVITIPYTPAKLNINPRDHITIYGSYSKHRRIVRWRIFVVDTTLPYIRATLIIIYQKNALINAIFVRSLYVYNIVAIIP